MSPRKRARPNPSEGGSGGPLPPANDRQTTTLPERSSAGSQAPIVPAVPTASAVSAVPLSSSQSTASSTASKPASQKSGKQVHKTRSWYGSWPRAPKSSASTQVARETILGGTLKPDKSPNFARYDTKKSTAAESPGLGAGSSECASTTTLPRIQEADTNTAQTVAEEEPTPSLRDASEANAGTATLAALDGHKINDSALPELPRPPVLDVGQRPATASGWLGWFGRPATATAPTSAAEPPPEPADIPAEREPAGAKEPDTPQPPDDATMTTLPFRPDTPAQTFWFGFWTRGNPVTEQSQNQTASPANLKPDADTAKEQEDVPMPDAGELDKADAKSLGNTESADAGSPQAQPAGSTWAFWSRDTRPKSKGASTPRQEPGEIAVIGQGSEAHPQPARSVEVQGAVPSSPAAAAADSGPVPATPPPGASSTKDASKKPKRLRPQSMDMPDPPGRPDTPKSVSSIQVDSTRKPAASRTESPAKAAPANLLLPSFRSTYRMKENPSILRQITQFLLRTQQPPSTNHVFLAKEPPRIKKALAIGVHGLFPAAFLRPMIGQPTGTSIKFANHCAEGIRRWADSNGSEDCEIEKVALEGEGKIGERVENLWKLLLNWINHIREADLIILACHSQGVPVAIMLVAKLIDYGIITTPRIGVCAMAGVCLGPFPDYRSGMGMLMGSAAELWDFANPESEVSKRYEASLKMVLDYGVRTTFIGSIDDQVVPIESAVYSPASHPYIYRAVFIDGRLHAPDFIATLVGFALRLRNMGISDHGLVRELSVPLAGSLYSGEGHSRLYDDPQVYDLAIAHALETSNVGRVPCVIRKHEGVANPNPYHLPWVMRGLLEEDFVKTELSAETAELLKQFDDWKPITKALKDVKYRLEAVRSKL